MALIVNTQLAARSNVSSSAPQLRASRPRAVVAARSSKANVTASGKLIKDNIMEVIGNTPMVKISSGVVGTENATVVGKMESLEPCSSVKDRLALALIDDAEKKGQIAPGKTTLVEATSGNTGIAMAMIAAKKGYKAIFTMPASASLERRIAMRSFGAELILTDPTKGAKGAVMKKDELMASVPNAVNLDQFGNEANPEMHYRTTGPEIWAQTEGKVDIFVSGVGTGGTVIGVAKFLKEKNPKVKVVAVEPAESPVLSGGKPGPHPIQGIGAGFVPDVFEKQKGLVDEIIQVPGAEAVAMAKKMSVVDGMMVGPSSGAAVKAAADLAARPENKGKLIVAIIPSFGERYLSSLLYQQIREECEKMSWQPPASEAAAPVAR